MTGARDARLVRDGGRVREGDGEPRVQARELFATLGGHGRFAMQMLGALAGASAMALLALLSLLLAVKSVPAGLPYGDIPAALVAMGLAASLVALAAAAAYAAQYAYHAHAAEQDPTYENPYGVGAAAGPGWRSLARLTHRATVLLMAAAYLAFAAGGVLVVHFGVSAMPLMSQGGWAASPR